HIASSNATEMAKAEALVAEMDRQFREQSKKYEKTITLEADWTVYGKLAPAHENILRVWAKILPLSRATKNQEAYEVWANEGTLAGAAQAKVLEELTVFNKTSGDTNADAATKAAGMGRFWVLTLLILTMSLGATIAYLIMKSTTSGLRRAVNDLNRGAGQVTAAAAQISMGSQSLAQGTSEQAA